MFQKKIIEQDCLELDAQDKLAYLREEFQLPELLINMDGNSLGALPKRTIQKMNTTIQEEWGNGLIRSWSEAGWFDAPQRIGDKIAPLIGAKKGEVLVADTTSINIFKALTAASSMNSNRTILLSEKDNFPTDLYLMQGISHFTKGRIQTKIVEPAQLMDALTEDVAVLLLTQVNYKTAHIKDMKAITQAAHEKGILTIWDLSHSVGSIEVNLEAAKVDFAVGCGYKFLNGGPGAPAFIYVAQRHQQHAPNILSGWMGHQDPFAFSTDYTPANSINRFRCGTPVILGMAALESGVELFQKTSMFELRKKAIQLSELFIQLMEQECREFGFELVSPQIVEKRGGHVSYSHSEGHAIYQAIKRRGVISDFRTPSILRFGITSMYLRFIDIYKVVQTLKKVMETRAWDKAEYKVRAAIT